MLARPTHRPFSLTLLLWLSLLVASSCMAQDQEAQHATLPATDGVEIAYAVRGEGELALVFLHCWACNQEFWREQVEVFAQDYKVVTLDFPGHGESGRNRKGWSLSGYAQDVRAVVEALDLQRLILIGHSMGAPVALASYPLLADRTLGVIAVESLHDVEKEIPPEALEGWAKTMEADFETTMQQMVTGMFAETDSPELRDWVIAQADAADHKAMIALVRDFANVDQKAWLAATEVPVRAINATANPPVIPETETESNQKYADFDVLYMEGVGHYLLLENPEDFNALLRVQIEEVLLSSP